MDLIIVISCVIAIAVIAFILGVRAKDLPEPEPVSPFAHLDERKAAIYENLRDLQFEYRVGKLSGEDYQNTKQDLQKELASVMAEVDRLRARISGNGAAPPPKPPAAPSKPAAEKPAAVKPAPETPRSAGFVCPSCGSSFETDLKFCGECGKSMKVAKA